MQRFKKHFFAFIGICFITAFCGCSRLGDDEFSSQNPNLSETTLTLDFDAEVNTTTYRSVTFTNRSNTEYYQIFNIAKSNDVCSAFSLYNITNEDNVVLYDARQSTNTTSDSYSLSVTLAPGESANINIEFSPIACAIREYQPTLVIYYETSDNTQTQTVYLHAVVTDNSTANTCSTIHQISDLSELTGEEPSRLLPALPEGQYYAMVPYMIRGYLQPTEGFASLAAEVYAYFDNPDVPQPGYLAPYLPVVYREDGLLQILKITPCRGFHFPTSVTDAYFLTATQILTTEMDYDFNIETEDEDNLGHVTIPGFTPTISANINNPSSIVQNEEGNFAIKFQTNLTTGYTETNDYLQNSIGKILDEDGNDLLQIENNGVNSRMYGSPLRHGEMILVGIGYILPEGYLMSNEAISGLIDTQAYIYLQLHVKVVIVDETQIPITISDFEG